MTRVLRPFAVVALAPVVLLATAAVYGGWWVVAGALYMTLFAFALDQIISTTAAPANPAAPHPGANALSVILALSHFGLLALMVWALAGGSGLPWGQRCVLFVAAGLFFGQVSNSNAHELIHRGNRTLFTLGKWVYISLLFGHHTSAHLKVHHRYVASSKDPNSARDGESFYHFAPRAWKGSFLAGYRAERKDLARRNRGGMTPYGVYIGAGMGMLAAAWAIGGGAGVMALVALSVYAQTQLLLSDYVQHYGLARSPLSTGKLVPVGPEHSWNAPHWFTAHLMLNAPRHSDHHAHPARPYPALQLPAANVAPILPYSLPVMATLALFPRPWRRVMAQAKRDWQAANTP